MKKLIIVGLLIAGLNVQAQKWVKDVKNNDSEITNVYDYVSHGDIIARKWTNLNSGRKFITSVSKSEYCTVWKSGYDNYVSFTVDNVVVKVDPKNKYNTVIVMEDNSEIKDLASVYLNEDGKFEFILDLNSQAISYLKKKNIKEFKIKTDVDDYEIDSAENELDYDFIKRISNLIWPES